MESEGLVRELLVVLPVRSLNPKFHTRIVFDGQNRTAPHSAMYISAALIALFRPSFLYIWVIYRFFASSDRKFRLICNEMRAARSLLITSGVSIAADKLFNRSREVQVCTGGYTQTYPNLRLVSLFPTGKEN
jgi:hypothetical protein